MICPNCQKEVLSVDKFCPYCGKPMNVEEKAAEETAVVEETVEEAAKETAEDAVEETDDETAEAIKEVLVSAADAEKKSKAVVNVLTALIIVAVAVVAFLLGGKLLGGNNAAVTTDTSVTTDMTDVTGDVTDAADAGEIPFDGIYDNYETKYKDGFDYRNTNISEYITLGNYKGQTAEVTTSSEFTDEEFADMLNYFLLQYAEVGDVVTDRPAAMNDTVVIDYVGTVDGVAFEGGTGTEQTATLGMGQYIPGFEEGIVGMNIGDTKNVYVTFPENYGVDSLNGKDAIFAITLRSITSNTLPEYTDEFVSENFSFDTVAEFEDALRQSKAEDANSERYSAALEILTEGSEMKKYPDGTVEDYIYQQVSYDKYYAESYGMTVAEYISGYYGLAVSEYEAQLQTMAENMIKQEFALYALAAAEGITVTDEEMATEVENYLEYYGYTDVETLCTEMGISETLLENSLHFSAIYTKVMDFMMENTTFIVVE